ncbi:MAG TPA: RdgB/HAM1 family non-canonical purine NTP pyrophosphatase [Bacteroidia bacterium]|jgi:XTP/dITP diphosphohydrolase|nr:RdgB/HAM1 family non-canonical purine NTP pyrophosphatase [Bacteroidia bacterium]
MRLLFASQNRHKMEEIKPLLPDSIELLCLGDLGYQDEIPETSDTLRGNALQKAQFIFDKFSSLLPALGVAGCFADDTGLEIEALDGRPGVYSARYAGENKSAADNINKVLAELEGEVNRAAIFKTVIALVGLGEPLFFEGIVKGIITKEKHGTSGFGYDPVFMPDGYNITFAEMSLEQKNTLSHRGIAVRKFAGYLNMQSSK